jgi:hypothetical protein
MMRCSCSSRILEVRYAAQQPEQKGCSQSKARAIRSGESSKQIGHTNGSEDDDSEPLREAEGRAVLEIGAVGEHLAEDLVGETREESSLEDDRVVRRAGPPAPGWEEEEE